MRTIALLVLLSGLAGALPARAELSFATASERAEAAEAVDYAIAEAQARIAALERDLADPDVYLVSAAGRMVRLTSGHLDKLIGFVRVLYFANRDRLDSAVGAAARLSGLPAFAIRDALADPDSLAGKAAILFARKKLRERATADRPAVDAEIAELKRLLAETEALKAEVAASEAGAGP